MHKLHISLKFSNIEGRELDIINYRGLIRFSQLLEVFSPLFFVEKFFKFSDKKWRNFKYAFSQSTIYYCYFKSELSSSKLSKFNCLVNPVTIWYRTQSIHCSPTPEDKLRRRYLVISLSVMWSLRKDNHVTVD